MPTIDVTALLAAVLAAAIAMVSLRANARTSRRLKQYELEATFEQENRTRRENRNQSVQDIVDTYRQPLVEAAWRLGNRLHLVRLEALTGPGRDSADVARKRQLTTSFRFAQFFAWREILFTRLHVLTLESEAETAEAGHILEDTILAMASSQLDLQSAALWAEEQRAVGERMCQQRGADGSRPAGYAGFVDAYAETFGDWLEAPIGAVLDGEGPGSDRVRLMQWALMALVTHLDREKSRPESEWMVSTYDELRRWRVEDASTDRERQIATRAQRIVVGPNP